VKELKAKQDIDISNNYPYLSDLSIHRNIDRMTESIRSQYTNTINNITITRDTDLDYLSHYFPLEANINLIFNLYKYVYCAKLGESLIVKSIDETGKPYIDLRPTDDLNIFAYWFNDKVYYVHKDEINKIDEVFNNDFNNSTLWIDSSKSNSIDKYKSIMLEQLSTKSVSITMKFNDDSSVRIHNNNIDLTIKQPSLVDAIKQLLIKSLK
jgi:hypothetical protein